MKSVRGVIILLVSQSLSTSVFAEYKSKSLFDTDYRCIADEVGGFNHRKDGHHQTRFKVNKEFFLTHISNIPDEAFLDFYKSYEYRNHIGKSDNIDSVRKQYDESYLQQEIIDFSSGKTVTEKGAYFIREPKMNPKSWETYRRSCETIRDPILYNHIHCYQETVNSLFTIDLDTKRFSYAQLGSWHMRQDIPDYYGASSYFAFGKCEEYYR